MKNNKKKITTNVYRKHVTRNWDCSCLIMTHKNVHLCFNIYRVVIGDLNIGIKIRNVFKTYNGIHPIVGICYMVI